jgi:hypothetical protein
MFTRERLNSTKHRRLAVATVGFATVVALTLAFTPNSISAGDNRGSAGLADSEIVEFSPTLFPSRDMRLRSPTFQADHTGTNQEYIVHSTDVLAIWVAGTDNMPRKGLKLSAGVHGQPPPKPGLLVDAFLVVDSVELRIPCSLFLGRETEKLTVTVENHSAPFTLYDDVSDEWIFDADKTAWSKLSSLIEEKFQRELRKHGIQLGYRLMPREQIHLVPGDEFVLQLIARTPAVQGDLDNLPHRTTEFRLTVGSDGCVTMPAVTSPKVVVPSESFTPLQRKFFGAVGRSTHTIRVFDPRLPLKDRCTVDDIIDCLNVAPSPSEELNTPLPEGLARKCRQLGINQHFRTQPRSEQLIQVRYYAIPPKRTWTLVMPDGSTIVTPFVASTSIPIAIRQAVARSDQVGAVSKFRNAIIFVSPYPGREVPGEPLVFSATIPFKGRSLLDSYMLMPGDRILIKEFAE